MALAVLLENADMQPKESGDDFTIISSTDHPYAISDALKKYLRETKKSLVISAPYKSKNFVDMIRTFIPQPEDVRKKLITRPPDDKDLRTFRTIESFADIANSKVMCKPYLHAKFVIIDNNIVLFGSVNPTSAGIYDNDEILYISKNPMHVKRHIEIFYKLWNCPRNIAWENFQLYHGYKDYGERYDMHRVIAKTIWNCFDKNDNQAIPKAVLCEQIARKGFDKDDVIETVKALLDDGKLYEPKPDMLRLTDYQTDMYDF